MTDQQFLIWLHERLEHVHGEEPLMDYMHRLRAIIRTIDPEETTHIIGFNSLEELKEELKALKGQ